MKFLIYYTQGEAWIEGKPVNEQPYIVHHAVYIQQLYDQGKILLGGPFQQHPGGANFVEMANREEAQQMVDNDPIIIHNVVTAVIAPWEPLFNKYENRSPGYTTDLLKAGH